MPKTTNTPMTSPAQSPRSEVFMIWCLVKANKASSKKIPTPAKINFNAFGSKEEKSGEGSGIFEIWASIFSTTYIVLHDLRNKISPGKKRSKSKAQSKKKQNQTIFEPNVFLHQKGNGDKSGEKM